MPMSAETFVESDSIEITGKAPNQTKVIEFLTEYPHLAFTQREIQEALGVRHQASMNTTLRTLYNRQLIDKKVNTDGLIYYMIKGAGTTNLFAEHSE